MHQVSASRTLDEQCVCASNEEHCIGFVLMLGL
jgi:hypothetical protein